MPRFVLLYHDCPPHYERSSHWDLMLESGGVLRTWALAHLPYAWESWRQQTAQSHPECPPAVTADCVAAERLADHRLDYLDLEGPLSGDRGQVCRVDRGTYERNVDSPGRWQVALAGGTWTGSITLQQGEDGDRTWTLTVDSSER